MKRHLKTLTVPVSWPVERKEQKFIIKGHPGKSFELSMPLALVFKSLLKYCKTMKEIKATLMDKEILVDGVRRKDPKYPVGVMDVITIPLSNEHYRILINKKRKLQLLAITKEESSEKICKIIGKVQLKKGKIQLNLFDGRNILSKDNKIKIGDSALLKLPKQEIKEILKMEKGNYAYMTGGTHIGEHGIIEHIADDLVTIKTKEDKFDTPKRFVFVTGKENSLLKMID